MLNDGSKVIAICSADNCAEYNTRFLRALHLEAGNFPFKVLFFACFSSLYQNEKHDQGESKIFQLMNHDLLDGIIMLSETIKNDDIRMQIANRAKEKNIPVVAIEHPIDGCYNIIYEYNHTISSLIEHLIVDHHYTRINFLAGLKGNSFSEERLQIYRDVLTKHQIPIEEERIGYGEFWAAPTKAVLDHFMQSDLPFPEAIVCSNDIMAITTIHYLMDAGYRIPEDVAVTGFDGIEEALDHVPPITTVQYDQEQTAHHAYQMLEDIFQGKTPPQTSYISSKIVYGTTCGCQKNTRNYNVLTRHLYDRLDSQHQFNEIQIAMAADLTDNDNFQGIFTNLMRYGDTFGATKYWLCIVDDFLDESEELADIIFDDNSAKRGSYTSHMDLMLSCIYGQWQDTSHFQTTDLLPDLEEKLAGNDCLMFLPLHVLEQTIGYVALTYNPDTVNMSFLYQLLMNISNALESTKIRQRQQNMITSLANKYIHDPMTGLYNRRGFYQKAQPLFDTCVQQKQMILVASVDLNGLKYINDTYGHADGDIAISTVGDTLSRITAENLTCARFGGDEFVAACTIENAEDTTYIRTQILDYLNYYNHRSEKPYEVSASIGIVAVIPDSDITLDELIKYADEKMYEEKAIHHLRRKDS
ncbi:MAG: GGDEF domain-containing protein [Lachnospiraceae bacterium]|nr:GGDEF domain-containing protein [Lachnospiraceae bacterium]